MDKINALRNLMNERGLDAYIVSGGDAHNNDRMADYWRARSWVSGFTGSNGLLVVTQTEAGLWTDGRYFVQAEQELANTCIDLFRMGEPDVPTYENFLLDKLPQGGKLGFDGRTMSSAAFCALKDKLDAKKLTYCYSEDLVGMIWANRPSLSCEPAFEHPPNFAGLSAAEKLQKVREKMADGKMTAYLVTALDGIAWLLNVRGHDIDNTPVVYSYALITQKDALIFIDKAKVADFYGKLTSQGFTIESYEAVTEKLSSLPPGGKIYYDANKTNVLVESAIAQGIERPNKDKDMDILTALKGVKSEIELNNIKNAYIKEGVAMTKTLKWVGDVIAAGKPINEEDVAKTITSFRKQQKDFLRDGFETIAAYGPNAALPHYRPEGTGAAIKPQGFLLIDTGGQYMDGTTDTTRTIVVGEITDEMRRDFTLVLKGHIALTNAVFPTGTTGHALDMLARQPVLSGCKDYNHGTGHGIGYCLGVHEGPHSLSSRHADVALVPGMIMSNEPGIYEPGRYGIRIENIIAVRELCKNNHGSFLNFENLTYCPYDTRAIDVSLLTQAEIDFVNAYHKKVYEVLSPHMDADEKKWLENATAKI